MTSPRFLNRLRPLRFLAHFLTGAVIGAWILFDALTLAVFWVQREYQDEVYPGVFMFSTSLVGKTPQGLADFLAEREKNLNTQRITFFWQNNGQKSWDITSSMIDFSLDKQGTADEAFSLGRKEAGWKSLVEVYRLLIFPQTIEPKYIYNSEQIDQVLEKIASEVDRPAQDALFEFKEGKVLNFQLSKEGRAVDKQQIKSLTLLAFQQAVEKGGKPIILELPVKTVQPKTTTDQSNRLGIKDLLAEGESFFFDSIPSRVHNIILASSYLHGIVIPPGETFSFAEKIGDISAKTGYQQAYVIKENKTILEDGGGVCQVSTTLFRAVMNAGLPIVERYPHYYRVAFYEQGGYPPGLDATVYPPSPDLKFKNDTTAYILIQTEVSKENKRLAFKLYGTSDGRRVEVEKPIIYSKTPPPDPVYIDDPTLPVGVQKRVDTAHWGAKVSVTRRVWAVGGELLEEKTFWSNYAPWAAVYKRGTKI